MEKTGEGFALVEGPGNAEDWPSTQAGLRSSGKASTGHWIRYAEQRTGIVSIDEQGKWLNSTGEAGRSKPMSGLGR